MTLLAVKKYVADQASSVSLANTIWKQVVSSRQRPKRGKAGYNVFVIVGRVRRRERRATAPRGSAEKELPYEVEVILYAEHSEEQSGGDNFDVLCENAAKVYRAAAVGNPTITDPVTAETSYLSDVGEEMDLDQLIPTYTDEAESRVAFQAILTLVLHEVLSPA